MLAACGGQNTSPADAEPPAELVTGARVLVTRAVPAREAADPAAPVVGSLLPGAAGRLEERSATEQAWWRVAFEEGIAGWLPASDLQAVPAGAVKAFPTAEGFGAVAQGGRGGRVLEVTNLNDSGPGSLRAALAAAGPRTVVFRTGGTIVLRSPIRITEPYLTVAGQTAPGGGIAIRNDPVNTGPPLIVETHDVILRFLRVRPGPSDRPTCCLDGLQIGQGARAVIIDHGSFSWAVDEVLDAWYDAREITVQWSIVAEGLNRSSHEKGRHSRGLLFGGEGGDYSIHHNLFAHNAQRNPLLAPGTGIADVVNNVIYDPQSYVSHLDDSHGTVRVNYVGNLFLPGPRTNFPTLPLFALDAVSHPAGAGGFRLYLRGNLDELHRPDEALPEALAVEPADRRHLTDERHPAPLVRTTSAARAFAEVLARAGATLPERDAVDARIVREVRERTGTLVDHPEEVGGWPALARGTAPTDADHDGMPDDWERREGLDPYDPADRNGDRDGDGYTNLEAYLNEVAGDLAP